MVIDSLLITAHIITQMTFDLESTVVLVDITSMPKWWSNKLIILLTSQYLTISLGNKTYRISSDFSTKYDSFGKLRASSGILADFQYMYSVGFDYFHHCKDYFRFFAHDIVI